MKQAIIGISLILIACALRLRHEGTVDFSKQINGKFVKDNLVQSNLLYYFGNINQDEYFRWSSYQQLNRSQGQISECERDKPFAIYTQNKFEKCIACEPLQKVSSLALFNLQTRECEVCIWGVNEICNTFLKKQLFGLCAPAQPLYNPKTKTCEQCPQFYEYNGPSQSCVPIIFTTNLNASRILMSKPNGLQQQKYKIQQDNPSRLVQQCPINKPYLQGKTCTPCQNNLLFDLASQKCVQCGHKKVYSPKTFECVDISAYDIFYPDITAPNIVSQTMNYDAWKSKVQDSVKLSPRMTKCPNHKPFVIDGKCVSCDSSTPLFDIDRQECVACSKGRRYDSDKRTCVGIYDTSQSWKRKIAHID